jgi:Sigma-70 factor, region 1.1
MSPRRPSRPKGCGTPKLSWLGRADIGVVAEIHIQIRIESTFPSTTEFSSRRSLEHALAKVGTVTGAGAGCGLMDVWVAVEHEDLAMTQIAELVDQFGLGERSRISVRRDDRERVDADDAPAVHELPEAHALVANELLALARSQGYVTYDQLNDLLPPEVETAQAIDAWILLLENEGISIVKSPP